MSFSFQSLETISLVDKLSNTFATEMCEDGRISILTDSNAFIYTLMNYSDNEFSDMAFKKKAINIPECSLREELGFEFASICDTTTEVDLHRVMRNLDLNSYLDNPAFVDLKPMALKWSPKGLQGKSFCVLALLNNLGGLSIISEYRNATDALEYRCVCNVTRSIVNQASKEWVFKSDSYRVSENEWKKRLQAVCPKAFVWSHMIENYAIFFIAHPQGNVTFWKFTRIEEDDLDPNPLQYMGSFTSSLKNISAMHWIKYGRNEGALCLGNIEGKLSALRISNLNSDEINYDEEKILSVEDSMKRINYITSIEHESFLYLISADETFIHIFPILNDGTILEEVLFNTGGTATTGICHYKDNILLVLNAGKLRKLTLKSKDMSVEIEAENVPLNFDDTIYKACGIVLSKNRIFLGILGFPHRLRDITRQHSPSKFCIFYDSSQSPLMMIMGITDESLADYWDLFEVLRILSYKEKKFPWQGIAEMNHDKLTLTQLKSLRWIAKMSEKIYNIVPKINGYHIKPYVLLHHLVTIQLVVERMKKLLNLLVEGKELTVFQMQSLDISNMYLKEMVLMKILQKSKVGERFVDDMIDVMEVANELEYPDMPPCFWCGEKIIGPTCIPNHKDSRCSISMMQIYLTPGFKCPFCECVAHAEMAKEYDVVTCPYCDVPMYQRYSSKSVDKILETTDELNRQRMELSLQVDVPKDSSNVDGFPDDASLEDLEDPAEYLVLSDDDDEDAMKERLESIRKEFLEPNNTSDEPSDLNESNVIPDNLSEENDSSNENSIEIIEYEDETQNSVDS